MLKVELPDPTTGFGLNELLVRLGSPVTLSWTLPLKPFIAVIVIVYLVELFIRIVCDAGETAIEKFVGAVTTSVAEVVCTSAPLVALIVNGYVPPAVEASVDTIITEVPEPVTDVGVNVALAPVGNPLTLKPTLPLNPPLAVMVTL